MSRKRIKKNSILPWIIMVVVLFVLGISWVIDHTGSGDACGERGVDEDKKGYCNVGNDDYEQLVIVTGNHQNSPVPNLDFSKNEDLSELLAGVFYNAKTGKSPNISIISAARGNDYIKFNLTKPAKNISASKNNLMKLERSINEAIKTTPKRGGADYLGAIVKAGNSIKSNGGSRGAILVIGSGYSDSGVLLNFVNDNVIDNYLSHKDYVSYRLSHNDAVNAGLLEGVSVQWYDIGQTIAPQRSLDDYIPYTKNIYKDALSYLGASDINLDLDSHNTDQRQIDTKNTVNPVQPEELRRGDYISIDDTVSRFENNKTKLTNSAAVRDYLLSFVERFKHSNYELEITGYVDNCDESLSGLAKGRAEAIKNELVKMGVSGDKITTKGVSGPPPADFSADYKCVDDKNVPNEEQRTVRIVVK